MLETHIVTPLCQFASLHVVVRGKWYIPFVLWICVSVCVCRWNRANALLNGLALPLFVSMHIYIIFDCVLCKMPFETLAQKRLPWGTARDRVADTRTMPFPWHGMKHIYILNGLVNDKEMNNKYEKPFSNHSRIVWELGNKKTHNIHSRLSEKVKWVQ